MRLRYVVIDELHVLRGLFGSHVAHVLRRLRRLCAHYGSDPVFCFTSATIGNPAELASQLVRPAGGARSATTPPRGPSARSRCGSGRCSTRTAARARRRTSRRPCCSRASCEDGHQTLAFTRSRRGSELVAAQARAMLDAAMPGGGSPEVAAYRAGYLADERRELEAKLAAGELGGVVATNALELGIDVGALDAVVCNGFPGTLASMRQQIGRAGRGSRRAAAVLVAGDDQLDQWYVRHPRELLARPAEAAVVNPANPFVARAQIACAAHELPLTHADERWFGECLDDAVRELAVDDLVKVRGGRVYWVGRRPPAPGVGLRSGSSLEYQLVEAGGAAGGHRRRHPGVPGRAPGRGVPAPGASVPGRGARHRRATSRCSRPPTTSTSTPSRARTPTSRSCTTTSTREVGAGVAHLGAVVVTHRLVAYQRRRSSTNEIIDTVPLDFPPRELTTRACWYTVPLDLLLARRRGAGAGDRSGARGRARADRAAAAVRDLRPLGRRRRVDGRAPPDGRTDDLRVRRLPRRCRHRRARVRAACAEHVDTAYELVTTCPCDDGCPSCVQSPKCGNWNEYLDKDAAGRLLGVLRDGSSAASSTRPDAT